ncbi:MAG: VOC family protein, partial [Novosphingobium sp.]|nr:VOC family protein [Novosphingobium sp.]
MRVNGLNHVNIVASDIEKTIRFYETVLGMRAAEIPMAPAG